MLLLLPYLHSVLIGVKSLSFVPVKSVSYFIVRYLPSNFLPAVHNMPGDVCRRDTQQGLPGLHEHNRS